MFLSFWDHVPFIDAITQFVLTMILLLKLMFFRCRFKCFLAAIEVPFLNTAWIAQEFIKSFSGMIYEVVRAGGIDSGVYQTERQQILVLHDLIIC